MRPLDGMRVLDLTQVMAGPWCGSYLGDMGADVIKVELPQGDVLRTKGQNDLAYLANNRSKRSIVLDYRNKDGVDVLLRLASRCDVILENSRPGVAERRGYGYETIRTSNHRVIYCAISGFGRDGPYAHKPSVDWTLQGVSGMMSWTGPEGGDPVRVGPIVSDFAAGAMACIGVLTALHVRDQTGEGQRVDVSLLDSSLHVFAQRLLEFPVRGTRLRPMGTKHPWNAPHKTFKTKDGWLNVGVQDEPRWRRFCIAIGLPELADDERFRSNADRVANRDALNDALDRVFVQRTNQDWLARLEAEDQLVGAVQTLEQVLEDPQVVHNRILVDVPHPEYPTLKLVDTAVRLSATPGGISRRPPILGEHTEEVLREAGFTDAEVRHIVATQTSKERT